LPFLGPPFFTFFSVVFGLGGADHTRFNASLKGIAASSAGVFCLAFLGELAMYRILSEQHPAAAASVGLILAGYTELEFALLNCLDALLADFDTIFKSLFRTRGETQRIEIGDAIGRHKFHAIGLGTEFETAIGALQYCRKIRNYYSHCYWFTDPQGFGYVDLEEVAKQNAMATEDNSFFTLRHLNDAVLSEQAAYFNATDSFLNWLQHEAQVKAGKIQKNEYSKPNITTRPPLYRP
jgi:hypothetical protein